MNSTRFKGKLVFFVKSVPSKGYKNPRLQGGVEDYIFSLSMKNLLVKIPHHNFFFLCFQTIFSLLALNPKFELS